MEIKSEQKTCIGEGEMRKKLEEMSRRRSVVGERKREMRGVLGK